MDHFTGIKQTVVTALEEDVGAGDITAALVEAGTPAIAHVVSREDAVICGRPWVDEVFRQVDCRVQLTWHFREGDRVDRCSRLFTARGHAGSILTAERTALNFLQLLSGTATRTRRYADLIAASGARLLDTRKTIPGLRLAQKYAVSTGGGMNHRAGLYDAFLIKENHIRALGSIAAGVALARNRGPECRVEVEVESLDQLAEAIAAAPDRIMLDNFSLDDMKLACERARGTAIELEASGGIETPEALVDIASTGVDYISVGALTKHNEAIDLSLRFE